jgi:hypothetical protein
MARLVLAGSWGGSNRRGLHELRGPRSGISVVAALRLTRTVHVRVRNVFELNFHLRGAHRGEERGKTTAAVSEEPNVPEDATSPCGPWGAVQQSEYTPYIDENHFFDDNGEDAVL